MLEKLKNFIINKATEYVAEELLERADIARDRQDCRSLHSEVHATNSEEEEEEL